MADCGPLCFVLPPFFPECRARTAVYRLHESL
jgi:hypothetical protein